MHSETNLYLWIEKFYFNVNIMYYTYETYVKLQ
jgi:hypothetical protein